MRSAGTTRSDRMFGLGRTTIGVRTGGRFRLNVYPDLPEGAPRLPERYRVGEELDGRGSWQRA